MGKPWKKRERPAVTRPEGSSDYKWSSQSYMLKDILANFKLPVVVQCREDTNAEHLQSFFFDLRQPILLHSQRTSRKVFARCVRKGDGGTVKELLPEVVIPEDYQGWFKISKWLDFSKPVPHKSVETLTRSNAEFFLCTTEFDAIVMTETADGDGNGSESFSRPVVEGEVLRKTGIQKLNRLLLPEPERSSTGDNRYLMCIDEKDCELFVPISQTGLFYEVSDGNFDKNDNCVVQILDILDEMIEMPLYVRHILGDPPPISKFYSPTLKLMRVKEEETIMGSTLDCEDDALPLEIQTNSDIKFEIALNTPMLQTCNEYVEAYEMCKNVSQNYVTDMKLAVTFKKASDNDESKDNEEHINQTFVADENDNQESISNSQRTSTSAGRESDFGEVEANSEFSIQWEPISTVRNTPDNQSGDIMAEQDSDSVNSVESVDTLQAVKLNSVLGGPFFETDHELNDTAAEILAKKLWRPRNLSDTGACTTEPPLQIDANNGFIMKPDERFMLKPDSPVEIVPMNSDIVEEVTDFSVRSVPKLNIERVRTSSPNAMMLSQSSFTDSLNSLPSTVTVPSLNKLSSRSTVISSNRSQVDLSDHFPSVMSNSAQSGIQSINSDAQTLKEISQNHAISQNETLSDQSMQLSNLSSARSGLSSTLNMSLLVNSVERTEGKLHMPYIFTGDVYISPNSDSSLNSTQNSGSSTDSMPDSLASFDSTKFRVVRSRDLPPRSGRTHPTPDIAQKVENMRHMSLSDDLMHFDEPSRTSSTSSIITCKVADEMVTSCNDLRLSLQEMTRTVRDSHAENSWREFCLERSSSLPVRSKTSPCKSQTPADEHSQSWEQLSPRRGENASLKNTQQTKPAKTLHKLNVDFDSSQGDKTHLISDTSSEDSVQYSHHSVDYDDQSQADNSSFTCSESSDLSIQDGTESILDEAMAEMDIYLNRVNSDTSIKNATTLTRDKAVLTQKMKIRHEIKRKQCADWNDVVEVI